MVQHPASSKPGDVRLATRVSQSPPGGLIGGAIAILVMVLALAGVLPRPMFLVGAGALVAVAYTLDKRFKANAPPGPDGSDSSNEPVVAPPAAATSMSPVTPVSPVAPGAPSAPPPAILPISDLKAEHARLTRELTDRVDDDEDVRFEKFMRLRRIEDEIERQHGTPPA
jgi:hypothetical protein